MKARTIKLAVLLASTALLACGLLQVSLRTNAGAERKGVRIRFRVTAVEESSDGRSAVSDAFVEGPPGTDFNVNLQDGRFRMRARFLTDLNDGGGLTLRAKLDTRRFFGTSENGLPLYEEDSQSQTLRLGFEEAVVLLPFGRGGDPRLKIEITPELTDRPSHAPSGQLLPPEIRIEKPVQGGVISIEANKIPHHFNVDAVLFADGREVARGSAHCLIEEAREVVLRGTPRSGQEGDAPLVLNLAVERFEPGRPSDRVAVRFDALRPNPQSPGRPDALLSNWAGVANLDSYLTYDLSEYFPVPHGRKYELKVKVASRPII